MPILVIVLVGAVVVGYVLRGRIRNVEHLRLRWWPLAPLGLVMQLVPVPGSGEISRNAEFGLLLASFPVLIAFAVANLRLAGFPLIVVGLVMNLVVIAANHGMPVTRQAVIASGNAEGLGALREGTGKHHLAEPDDVLLQLSDRLAVGSPFNEVLSAGDLFVYAGIAWVLIATMRGRPAPWSRPSRAPAGAPR